jgi:diketogulonate reductase-like aldo/keto reductase
MTVVLISNELHPYCQQKPIVDYCRAHGIIVQAYTPLVRGEFEKPVLQELSKKVCWLRSHYFLSLIFDSMARTLHKFLFVGLSSMGGLISLPNCAMTLNSGPSFIPLPKSQNPDRVRSNIDVFGFEITGEDIGKLDELDRGKEGAVTWNPIDVD